jgi:hypothetical protein
VAVDEIDAYLTGRLLTASEAVWRLLGLRLHKEHPPVYRLDVHLPAHQFVVFDPTVDARDIIAEAERTTSTLLEWFALNDRDPTARQYLYTEIPEHYIWKNGSWFERARSGCVAVGRMYSVSLINFELFAMRTLLKCQRGCRNYSDLLTVDGFIYSTFREACGAFGFANDDSEFIACFSEILETTILSTAALRHQFAFMLCSIKTLNAQAVFEHFAVDLCGSDTRTATLCGIECKMQLLGRSLNDDDFGFANVPLIGEVDRPCVPLEEGPSLTAEQQQALNKIIAIAQDETISSKVITILAPAGTGKTFFVHRAVTALNLAGASSMCVAASCLASTLLPQGQTAHQAFKIPLMCDDCSYCNWNQSVRTKLYSTSVIFWDEVSMVSCAIAETVDRSFRQLMQTDELFGGKVIVFLGDFRQLPPVIRGGNGEYVSLLGSSWFQKAHKLTFSHNFRSIDPAFSHLLECVGDGILDSICIPPESIACNIEDIIDRVYGNDVTSDNNFSNMILAYTLDQCAIVNASVFSRISSAGSSISYAADDLSNCRSPDEYPAEYVASLHVHGTPPAELTMKIKARYMILRNLDPPFVCNGVLAECVSVTRLLCSMKLLSGPGKGKIVQLPRVSFVVKSEQSGLPFAFGRRQFPIAPAYCVTVHKSQGQSLNKIGIIAETDAFAHGQVYVAMSRVGCWSNIVFHSPRAECFLKNKVSKRLINAMQRMHSWV